MPIGRFAKSCRLTVKALRHYDETGLLRPAYVDPSSGYRYYARHQAREAVLIGMLRTLDVPIADIKTLLSADETTIQLEMEQQQQKIKQKIIRQKQILLSIGRLAREGQLLPYDVQVRDEPAFVVAQLSCVSNADNMLDDSAALIYSLYDELVSSGRNFQHPVMCINEDPDESERILIRGCIGISAPYPDLPTAKIVDIEGGPTAWLTHQGAYEELGIAYHALFAWAQSYGYEQRGAMREIYCNDPAQTPVEDLITEVLLPVK